MPCIRTGTPKRCSSSALGIDLGFGHVEACADDASLRCGAGRRLRERREQHRAQGLGLFQRVLANDRSQRSETLRMVLDIAVVEPALGNHAAQHAVEQRDVGAGFDGQKKIRRRGGIGAAWIDDDDLEVGMVAFRRLDAAKQHRMCVGHVGARDEQAISVRYVVIAGRRRIGAQRAFVAGYRG